MVLFSEMNGCFEISNWCNLLFVKVDSFLMKNCWVSDKLFSRRKKMKQYIISVFFVFFFFQISKVLVLDFLAIVSLLLNALIPLPLNSCRPNLAFFFLCLPNSYKKYRPGKYFLPFDCSVIFYIHHCVCVMLSNLYSEW